MFHPLGLNQLVLPSRVQVLGLEFKQGVQYWYLAPLTEDLPELRAVLNTVTLIALLSLRAKYSQC